jgi:hypothetical protein
MRHSIRLNGFNHYNDLALIISIAGVIIYFAAGYFSLDYFIDLFGFILWFSGVSFFSFRIIRNFFNDFNDSLMLVPLLIFFILGFSFGIVNSFLFLNYLAIVFCLLVSLLFFVFFDNLLGSVELKPINNQDDFLNRNNVRIYNYIFLSFGLLLSIIGFYFLFSSISFDKVFNPWLFLPLIYPFICLLVFVWNLIFIFFSKVNKNLILFSIIILSFLVHGYLLVAGEGFNADRFRHLGSEYRLTEAISQVDPEIKSANWNKTEQVLGLVIANPIINLSQFSYSFQWSLVAFLSSIVKVDVYFIDLYLGWILSSLFLPLLFYVGAKYIINSNNFRLLTAQISLLPFVLVYYSGQTIPLVFGFLFFLLFLLFVFSLLEHSSPKKIYFLITLVFLSIFSYALSFILSFTLLIFFILRKYKTILLIPFSIVIFLIDLISPYSWLNNYLFSGKISVIVDRFFDLNILFFVDKWFYNRSYDWLIVFWQLLSLLIYSLLVVGCLFLLKKFKTSQVVYLIYLLALLVTNFLLSIIFLDGSLIISRRINVFIGVILVFIISIIIFKLLEQKNTLKPLAIVFLSIFFIFSFLSGPFTSFAVSGEEVEVARLLSEKINNKWNDYCILAETTILLPLESFTLREIAGGNFPIDSDHQQPELNQLLNETKFNFNQDTPQSVLKFSGKKKCFIVINREFASDNKIEDISEMIGSPELVGNNYLWLIKYER